MSVKRIFTCPLALLALEAKRILDAGDKYAARLATRIPPTWLADLRTELGVINTASGTRQTLKGEIGSLTQDQNTAIEDVTHQLGELRKFAKKAFQGQDVKLHEQFGVAADGKAKSGHHDLATLQQRARDVLANARAATNAAALAAVGWIKDDSDELSAAIDALGTTDGTQESDKVQHKGQTVSLNSLANDLYRGVTGLQLIAGKVFDDGELANQTIRDEFRIGSFPPPAPPKQPPTPPAPTSPSTPA